MQKLEKQFYNLKYERVFYSIIIENQNRKLLNLILSDILDEEIKIVKVEHTRLPINKSNEQSKSIDILVRTKDNVLINIELNINFGNYEKERNLIYYSSLYGSRVKRGKKYEYKVIQININFNTSSKMKPKDEFNLISKNTKDVFSKDFRIITVNIASYKRLCYDENIKGNKKHIYLVMLDANEEELIELSKKDKLVKDVSDRMFVLNDDGTFIRTITRDEELKMLGEAHGIQKGINESKITIAEEMLKDGVSIKNISKYTKLSKKEILKLKNK